MKLHEETTTASATCAEPRARSRWRVVALACVLVCLATATGRAQDEQPGHVTEIPDIPDTAPHVADWLARLADIELRVSIDRDVKGAEAALHALLAEPDALLTMAGNVSMAEQVKRVMLLLETNGADDTEQFEAAVREALTRNDQPALDSFGTRAAPLYEKLVLDLVRIGRENDAKAPLAQLMRADNRRGVNFLRSRIDAGQPLPTALALSGCDAYFQRDDDFAWSLVPGRAPRLVEPDLVGVLTDTLRAAGVLKQQDGTLQLMVRELSKGNQITQELAAALAASVARDDAQSAEVLLGGFLERYPQQGAKPFFEAMVSRPSPRVRQLAAERLDDFTESPGLRSRARDEDVRVRQLLASSLGVHQTFTATWPNRNLSPSLNHETLDPVLDAAALAAIDVLSQDPDPGVRELLVQALATQGEDVSSIIWERLAADPDPGVRAQVAARLERADTALQTRLLVALAGDAEAPVLDALRRRLGESVNWAEHGAAFLPVLQALHANTADPRGRGFSGDNVGASMLASPEVRLELTRWTLREGDRNAWARVLDYVGVYRKEGTPRDSMLIWLELQPEELATVFELLDTDTRPGLDGEVIKLLCTAPATLVGPAMEAVLADSDASVMTSLRAFTVLFGRSERTVDPALAERFVAFVSGERFRAWQAGVSVPFDINDPGHQRMLDLGNRIPAPARNAILLAVLRDAPEIGQRIWSLLRTYVSALPGGADLTREVLARWFDPEDAEWTPRRTELVAQAIHNLPESPEVAVPAQLMQAVKNPSYAEAAVSVMGQLRDPAYLPTLGECLRAEWFSDSTNFGVRNEVADRAVLALGNYASTEAARILLGAAAGLSPDYRAKCLAAAETIRKYQDAVAEWDRRAAVGDSRADAVAKLVALLKDPDPATRAASAGGLATLHAVEQLPALVALLKDPEVSVREAAKAALSRLEKSSP